MTAPTSAPTSSPKSAAATTAAAAPPKVKPDSWLQAALEGTPGRLRLFRALGVAACVVFGVLAFTSVSARSAALADARDDAAQLVRIQTIRTNLVAADSAATNAFLVGGLEADSTAQAYDNGLSTASRTIAAASGADARDATALRSVNDVVVDYGGLVETARANNRQGFPIGAAYLRAASTELHEKALPELQHLVITAQDRVADAYASADNAMPVILVALLGSVIVLIGAQIGMSRRTRRTFNVPMALATILVLVGGGLAAAVMAIVQSSADSARTGAYTTAVDLATARMDAFDAKSSESLTLIARGSGQAYEAQFQTLTKAARAALERTNNNAVLSALDSYLELHKKIRADDDGGDWDKAVQLATGTSAAYANGRFANFDDLSAAALRSQAASLSNDLGDTRTPLVIVRWVALAAALAGAVLAWRGVSTRLAEYR